MKTASKLIIGASFLAQCVTSSFAQNNSTDSKQIQSPEVKSFILSTSGTVMELSKTESTVNRLFAGECHQYLDNGVIKKYYINDFWFQEGGKELSGDERIKILTSPDCEAFINDTNNTEYVSFMIGEKFYLAEYDEKIFGKVEILSCIVRDNIKIYSISPMRFVKGDIVELLDFQFNYTTIGTPCASK